jgi:AraC-like DNA-binding protein
MDNPFDTLRLEILTVRCDKLTPAWRYDALNDPFHRIYFVPEGSGKIAHHGREFRLGPGRMQLIPAHSLMRARCPRAMVQYYIHFTTRLLSGLDLFQIAEPLYEVKLDDPVPVRDDFDRLIRCSGEKDPVRLFEAETIVRSFVVRFLAGWTGGGFFERLSAVVRFRKALDHIETHLADPIRLADLADLEGLNPVYFSNLFTRLLGCPPMRYINRKRIERSRQLLWGSPDTIENVASAVGFEDVFYFSRLFKSMTGLPPSEYRKQVAARPS